MRDIRPRRSGLAVALASLAAACAPSNSGAKAESSPGSANDTPSSVAVVPVREGVLERRITLPETVRAYQEATLYAKVGGYLKSIAVDRGDWVKPGQALAVLEVPEMQAEIGKLEAELHAAEVDNKRVNEAAQRAPDLVTPQAEDSARAKYEVAVANLKRTQTLMDYAKLTAPLAGVVTKRWVDPGVFIPAATASSSAMSSAVVTLSDFSRVRIEVAMPQTDVSLVKVGLPTTLTVRELPGRAFEGKVTRIAYALDDSTKTRGAEIELPNADGALRPGMYASVEVSLERKAGALLVPAEAIVTDKGKPFAFTVDANKAHRVALRVGLDDGVNVEVLDGLAPNALVVVSGAQSLTDALTVNWRIGPGGLFDRGRIQGSRARLEGTRLELEKTEQRVAREVVESVTLVQSLFEQIATAKAGLAAAQEALRLSQERKEFGIAAVLESILAEQDLTRARNDYVTAVAEYDKAQYGLARSAGSSDSLAADPTARSQSERP